MPHNGVRCLAFDPGFERLGVAVIEKINGKETLLHSDCIRTPASLSFFERLTMLGAAVEQLFHEYHPDAVALEEVYFSKNEKTAMKIAEVRGMLVYLTGAHECQLYEYTPNAVKVAITGYGKSDKTAIGMMVPRLIQLSPKKRLDDELDAIAIGLTCLATTGSFRK